MLLHPNRRERRPRGLRKATQLRGVTSEFWTTKAAVQLAFLLRWQHRTELVHTELVPNVIQNPYFTTRQRSGQTKIANCKAAFVDSRSEVTPLDDKSDHPRPPFSSILRTRSLGAH